MSRRSTLEEDLNNPEYDLTTVLRNHVHEINAGRIIFGEYHHLFSLLKKYPIKFKQYTKLKVTTFEYVLSEIEVYLNKDWCNLHNQPILPEEQLVVTLRYLATGMSYEDLAFTFRMGKSTICTLTTRTMSVLWKTLYPRHMPIPTVDRFLEIAEDFYNIWRLPHCLGAIDVRHIRIKRPANSGATYYNYQGFYSTTLQAVVDGRYRYVAIDVGGYGCQHDATTLRVSSFYSALKSKALKLPADDELPDSSIVAPYFFVGDGACPLMEHLMKPYPGRNLTSDEKIYNAWLSGTRNVVECAFGQDSQRWPIYYRLIQCRPKKVKLIAKTTCVLHNIIIDCERNNTSYKHSEEQNSLALTRVRSSTDTDDDEKDGFEVGSGREVREKIKTWVNEN